MSAGDRSPKKISNQPTPKDEPKKSSFLRKVVTLLALGVVVFGLVTMYMYSKSVGRYPNSWSKEDWKGYVSFSGETARDTARKASDKVQSVDWAKVGTKITDKTKSLWAKLTKVEERIEASLKKERERRGAEPTAVETGGEPTAEAARPENGSKSNYERGLESMRIAIQEYRKVDSDAALKTSNDRFIEARTYFSKALDECPEEQKPEIESMIQDCQQYIYDCQKRQKA